MDVFWMLVAIAICAGLLYLGHRIEPHHVSRDGNRFLCTGQWLSAQGETDGRKREVWVKVKPRGQLEVDVKRRMRHEVTQWWIEGKAAKPPPRHEVYVLRTTNILGQTERMTVKVPSKSRAVLTLDEAMKAAAE